VNYYQHHIGDYAAATAYLSLIEDAIYTRLLRVYYRDEKPLPADSATVAWLIGLRTRKEKETLGRLLPQFFTLHEDGWHNTRADEEIDQYHKTQNKGKAGAAARWGNKKEDLPQVASNADELPMQSAGNATQYAGQCEPDATHMQTQCTGNANQEPITINQQPITAKAKTPPAQARASEYPAETRTEPVRRASAEVHDAPKKPPKRINPLLLKPEDVSERTWCDFINYRKSKRADITENVINIFRREAKKADIPLEDAINYSIFRGWQGFEAGWYTGKNKTIAHTGGSHETYRKPDTGFGSGNSAVEQVWNNVMRDRQQRAKDELVIEGKLVVEDGQPLRPSLGLDL